MFYEQFSMLCQQNNIKETTLTRELGIGASAPGRWKNGSTPDLSNAKKIADYFNVSLDFLCGGSDGKNSVGVSTNSTVLQGISGRDILVGSSNDSALSEYEGQLLDIVRKLDLKSRTLLLMKAMELEENLGK